MRPRSAPSEPRISVNKLGEYMTATPARRRAIVREQRNPQPFIVPRYDIAQRAIVRALTGGAGDAVIDDSLRRLDRSRPQTPWQHQRRELCIAALQQFRAVIGALGLEGTEVSPGPQAPPHLKIAGVSVSVRPELVLNGKDRRGRPIAGVLKLCFAKTHPLTEESGPYVSTCLRRFAEDLLPGSANVRPELCRVLDVFSEKLYTAPRAHKRRLNEIAAACEEIARAWGDS